MLEESPRAVIRDALGVGVAVGAYGVAFGAASVAAGLSALQTSLMSLLAFTGGTQFAVIGVVTGGGTLVTALSGGLLLGSRNTLYAMRLAPLLQVRGLRRFLAAHGTIDETTAMAVARRDPNLSRLAFWWTFGGTFVCWNLTTLAGAFGAQALGDPAKFGLDAVVPAAFLALLAPRLRSDERSREEPAGRDAGRAQRRLGSRCAPELASGAAERRIRRMGTGAVERRIAVAAAGIALVLIPFTPPGVPVLASTAALLLAATVKR